MGAAIGLRGDFGSAELRALARTVRRAGAASSGWIQTERTLRQSVRILENGCGINEL